MPNDNIIEIRGLSYKHPAGSIGSRGNALDDINLSIRAGEFVVVTGPSGCGKTTLCRCIAGLIPHADRGTMAGEVLVCGKNTRENPPGALASCIALTFQSADDQLFSNSVEAEIAFGPEHMGMRPAEIDARITWALEATGASHLRYRLVDELSGGEKQRVAIAASIALQPAVLLLDEPTSELDPAAAGGLIDMLIGLNRRHGMTVLVVEHRLERLYKAMSRIIVMDHGRIALDGRPEDVFGQDLSPYGIAAPSVVVFPQRHDMLISRRKCAISLRDVEFAYQRSEKKVLDGISLDLFCGEVTVIMGANGSGKSTLAKHLNGLLRPDRGEILVDGEPTASKTVAYLARKVGIVFQNPDRQLFAETVADELAFAPKNVSLPPEDIAKAVSDAAGSLEIDNLLREPPFTLSGGEKQRVAIGSIMTLSPLGIVLDEPTLGLGYGMKERLAAMLHSHAASGRAIVVVTHDMEFAARHADRAIILSGGHIIADGAPAEILTSQKILCEASLYMSPASCTEKSTGIDSILSIDEKVRSE